MVFKMVLKSLSLGTATKISLLVRVARTFGESQNRGLHSLVSTRYLGTLEHFVKEIQNPGTPGLGGLCCTCSVSLNNEPCGALAGIWENFADSFKEQLTQRVKK